MGDGPLGPLPRLLVGALAVLLLHGCGDDADGAPNAPDDPSGPSAEDGGRMEADPAAPESPEPAAELEEPAQVDAGLGEAEDAGGAQPAALGAAPTAAPELRWIVDAPDIDARRSLASDLVLDAAGDLWIFGSHGPNNGDSRFWVANVSAGGAWLGGFTHNVGQFDTGSGMMWTAEGPVIGGYTAARNVEMRRRYAAAFGSDGAERWTATFQDVEATTGAFIAGRDGGFNLVGWIGEGETTQIVIDHIDALGAVTDSRRLEMEDTVIVTDAAWDQDLLLINGSRREGDARQRFLRAHDADLALQWEVAPAPCSSSKLALGADAIFVAGTDEAGDGCVSRYAQGQLSWTAPVTVDGESAQPRRVHANPWGQLLVAGSVQRPLEVPQPSVSESSDGWLKKLDPEGQELWHLEVASDADEQLQQVTTTADGDIVVTVCAVYSEVCQIRRYGP